MFKQAPIEDISFLLKESPRLQALECKNAEKFTFFKKQNNERISNINVTAAINKLVNHHVKLVSVCFVRDTLLTCYMEKLFHQRPEIPAHNIINFENKLIETINFLITNKASVLANQIPEEQKHNIADLVLVMDDLGLFN